MNAPFSAFSPYLVGAPVTRIMSGMSLTHQVGLGGKDCAKIDNVRPLWWKEDWTRGLGRVGRKR
jgi:hypothetical protein